MRLRMHLGEAEDDDPVLSLVNLIDVFLVIVAALLLAVAQNPLGPFAEGKVTVIRGAGTPQMEVVIKDGAKIERFRSDGGAASASGGVRAGTAYRLADGSLVYVPE